MNRHIRIYYFCTPFSSIVAQFPLLCLYLIKGSFYFAFKSNYFFGGPNLVLRHLSAWEHLLFANIIPCSIKNANENLEFSLEISLPHYLFAYKAQKRGQFIFERTKWNSLKIKSFFCFPHWCFKKCSEENVQRREQCNSFKYY